MEVSGTFIPGTGQCTKEADIMAMSQVEIERCLRILRLAGMRETLDARVLQAAQGETSFMDAFSMLLQDEIDSRRSRAIERRVKLSGLKDKKTLTDFDWQFNPKLPKKYCHELLTLKFIQRGEDTIIIGSPGTGKSHVAQAISHAALLASYRVIYREAHILFTEIFEATQFEERKKYFKVLSDADLVVIDDLFLRKRLPQDAADDLQEVIMNRYSARKSTIITSNRIIEDWGKCLGDNAVASAILDRLLHRGHMLKFQGKSYRLREASIRLANMKKTE